MTTALMGRCRLSRLTFSRLASSMHQSSLKKKNMTFASMRQSDLKKNVPSASSLVSRLGEKHGFDFDPKLPLPPKGTKECEETGDIAGAGARTLNNRTEPSSSCLSLWITNHKYVHSPRRDWLDGIIITSE